MDGHVVAAGVLDAPQVQDLGAGAAISSFLGETRSACVRCTIRGRVETPSRAVISHTSAPRARPARRRRVGVAAARVGVLVSWDPLEPGHEASTGVDRVTMRPGVMSMIWRAVAGR